MPNITPHQNEISFSYEDKGEWQDMYVSFFQKGNGELQEIQIHISNFSAFKDAIIHIYEEII